MHIAEFAQTELGADPATLSTLAAFKTRSGSLNTLLLSLHSHSLSLVTTLVVLYGAALDLSTLEIAYSVKRSISLDQADITEFLLNYFGGNQNSYHQKTHQINSSVACALDRHALLLLDEAVARSNLLIVCQLLEMFESIESKGLVNVLKYVNLRQMAMHAKWPLVDRVFRLVFDKFRLDLAYKLPNNKSLFALCFEFDNPPIYKLAIFSYYLKLNLKFNFNRK